MSHSDDETEAELEIERCREFGNPKLQLTAMKLHEVPQSIRKLRHLRELHIEDTFITSIPAWIGELQGLVSLRLVDNPLEHIPTAIQKLQNLRKLAIKGRSPKVASDAIGELKNLQLLALADLNLSRAPSWIRALKDLRFLNLSNNPLRTIPDWIGELHELQGLILDDSGLQELPDSLLKLLSLVDLQLHDNPALGIPPEILYSNPRRIIDYYFLIAEPAARQPLNEFKLVLVGRGGVGKTTLVHRLVTEQFKTFRRTPGIQITKWPMKIDDEDVSAHIWDFGGQEIMHGTHRFFMTERALYLVLISGREGTEDQDAEYWLSLIRSFAGDVPVIVLLHKWSDYPLELNRALLQEKYGRLAFLATDSESGHGIGQLREKVTELARALPGLKAAWPSSWRQIKEELPRKRKSWVTFEDFCAFCKKHGVASPSDHEALADCLHDLGLMLSYRHDEKLRKFGVLNPQWATKGIYEMLNSPKIRDDGGVFTIKSFGEALPVRAYPEELHSFLLALMLKFRLCHPLDTKGNKYLMPELLSKEEPPLEAEFPPADCLSFVYHYTSVLPEGLLPRFIVETYVHREPRHAWRSGAILERANCRAMVRGDVQARTVTIRVAGKGNGRRELLGIIREHFERIHNSYEKLAVTARVPIPGHPEVQIDYDQLLVYEREGEQQIVLPIAGRLQRFEVTQLLDGVDLDHVRRPSERREVALWEQAEPLRVFVAYSQKDAVFLDQLRAALVLHERRDELTVWSDVLTEPGEDWEAEISNRLERAQIAILLLSNDFFRSAYCMEKELPRVLERRANSECEVIPILVRECRYDKHPDLGKIQAIRPGKKPIDEHEKKDPAWKVVTEEIDKVIVRIKQLRSVTATKSSPLEELDKAIERFKHSKQS